MAEKLNTFLDRVLAAVPEDKKAEVRAAYSAAQDEITTIEETRQRVLETATKQTRWWEDNKDAVAERDRLRAVKSAEASSTPGIDPAEMDKRMNAMREETLQTGLGLVTTMSNIGLRHYQEFGEVLDARTLTENAIKANLPLDQFYDRSVAERRQTRANEAATAALAKAREEGKQEGFREALSKAGSAMPFPVGNTAPTTLAGLRKPEGANPFSLDAAVATANQVIAEQAARQ